MGTHVFFHAYMLKYAHLSKWWCVLQLGFFGILLVEFIAGRGIFEMVGLKVGNGLGFEF